MSDSSLRIVLSSSTVGGLSRPVQVIIVSSVMFTFISYWRTAAVVLCDLASTAYYIGGIVEEAIGPAAPWFILAVMIFSYAVRSIYIESCSLFVRGGVYRVVKEAMGGFLAKLSVSALMFDYILTGPISGVSAGQYIIGLLLDTISDHQSRFAVQRGYGRCHPPLGIGDHRLPDHALFLPPELAGHPRIERQGPENHDRHHDHGGCDVDLVRNYLDRARAGQQRAVCAGSFAQSGIRSRDRRGSGDRRRKRNVESAIPKPVNLCRKW